MSTDVSQGKTISKVMIQEIQRGNSMSTDIVLMRLIVNISQMTNIYETTKIKIEIFKEILN